MQMQREKFGATGVFLYGIGRSLAKLGLQSTMLPPVTLRAKFYYIERALKRALGPQPFTLA